MNGMQAKHSDLTWTQSIMEPKIKQTDILSLGPMFLFYKVNGDHAVRTENSFRVTMVTGY